ncbi:MAG TPA: Ig-like domain-containing protein, partial [Micromonosporaceae bacterium]|nr:Ig-like domain-containing protein [Micromonosporaceae bacterium]
MASHCRVVTSGETGHCCFCQVILFGTTDRCRAGIASSTPIRRSATNQILMFRPLVRFVAGVSAVAGIACSGSNETTLPPSRVLTSIFVTVTPAMIEAGQTAAATATGADQNGAAMQLVYAISWSSSNPSVATVTPTGSVSALGAGTTQIIATSGGKTGQALLTVTVGEGGVASVRLTPPTASMLVGSTSQLSAAPLDAEGNTLSGHTIIWSSSDTTKATVSQTGLVSAIAAGTVSITAACEGVIAQASITVTAPNTAVASVRVSPATVSLLPGATSQLSAATLDAAGNTLSGRSVKWSTSDTTKATVSQAGLVSGIAAGTATVTAESEGVTGQAAVTVLPPASKAVASVRLTPATVSLQVGATSQLSAVTLDDAGNTLSGRSVTWASADSTKATVSQTGLVSGIAAGTVSVTATSEGVTGQAAITVLSSTTPPNAVASIRVTPATLSLIVGSTSQLSVATLDAAGNPLSGRSVAWSSSDPTKVSVSQTGFVSANAAGTASVTATSEGV